MHKFTSCSVYGLLGEDSLSCDLSWEYYEIKGKIRTRKMTIMKEVSIGKFMSNFYLPTLENVSYHIHYVKILSKLFVE